MKVILMVILMLAGSTYLFAQLINTAVRSFSMGNSTIGLIGGIGASHLNPA
jgi:hypothetical protein